MKTGLVKFYNSSKGYGFITDDETGKEIFVHASGLLTQSIKQDDKVSFDVTDGKKGPNAINVKVI